MTFRYLNHISRNVNKTNAIRSTSQHNIERNIVDVDVYIWAERYLQNLELQLMTTRNQLELDVTNLWTSKSSKNSTKIDGYVASDIISIIHPCQKLKQRWYNFNTCRQYHDSPSEPTALQYPLSVSKTKGVQSWQPLKDSAQKRQKGQQRIPPTTDDGPYVSMNVARKRSPEPSSRSTKLKISYPPVVRPKPKIYNQSDPSGINLKVTKQQLPRVKFEFRPYPTHDQLPLLEPPVTCKPKPEAENVMESIVVPVPKHVQPLILMEENLEKKLHTPDVNVSSKRELSLMSVITSPWTIFVLTNAVVLHYYRKIAADAQIKSESADEKAKNIKRTDFSQIKNRYSTTSANALVCVQNVDNLKTENDTLTFSAKDDQTSSLLTKKHLKSRNKDTENTVQTMKDEAKRPTHSGLNDNSKRSTFLGTNCSGRLQPHVAKEEFIGIHWDSKRKRFKRKTANAITIQPLTITRTKSAQIGEQQKHSDKVATTKSPPDLDISRYVLASADLENLLSVSKCQDVIRNVFGSNSPTTTSSKLANGKTLRIRKTKSFTTLRPTTHIPIDSVRSDCDLKPKQECRGDCGQNSMATTTRAQQQITSKEIEGDIKLAQQKQLGKSMYCEFLEEQTSGFFEKTPSLNFFSPIKASNSLNFVCKWELNVEKPDKNASSLGTNFERVENAKSFRSFCSNLVHGGKAHANENQNLVLLPLKSKVGESSSTCQKVTVSSKMRRKKFKSLPTYTNFKKFLALLRWTLIIAAEKH